MKVLAMLVLVAVSTFLVSGQSTTNAPSDGSAAASDATTAAADATTAAATTAAPAATTSAAQSATQKSILDILKKLLG